jgi:hypothetical protein
MADLRRREAEKAAVLYGCADLIWCGFPSPAIGIQPFVERLREIIRRERPSLVYAPFTFNHHPEHRSLGQAAVRATPVDVLLRFYGIQTPVTPAFANRIYEAEDLSEWTRRALEVYESQTFMRRSFDAALRLQRLEATLFGSVCREVQSFCEPNADCRTGLADVLAEASSQLNLRKPNRIYRMWRDYETIWAHARRLAIRHSYE